MSFQYALYSVFPDAATHFNHTSVLYCLVMPSPTPFKYMHAEQMHACGWAQILQPLQEARMEVTAYPYNLDLVRLCSLLANELRAAGEPDPGVAPGSIQEELLMQMPEHSPFRLLAERASRARGLPSK